MISASRRTDVPAFYLKWFIKQINRGSFEVINPYNRQVSIVPATPDKVHTIVFWSKNFGPFIESGFGERLKAEGYNLFFNFTINSESALLEPNLPPLKERLAQLDYLGNHFDAKSINWRFDPICFYKTKEDGIFDNLHDFNLIASQAARSGIRRCITSFMDDYAKIQKRIAAIPGFSFIDPPLETKKEVVLKMEQALYPNTIRLLTCCEKELLEIIPSDSGIRKGSCIPNDFLMDIFGGHLSRTKDSGQRINKGCGCLAAVDIGSYNLHPCYHNCLFCYANPSSGGLRKKHADRVHSS